MRHSRSLGTSVGLKMTFLLGVIALPCNLPAQPADAAPPRGTPLPAAVAGEIAPPPLVEPVTDLPTAPAAHIESITLFPSQGEFSPAAAFNDQRFGYVLRGQLRAQYESNIFIQATGEVEDVIFGFSPGIAVGWGDFKGELTGAEAFRQRFERIVGKDYLFVDYAPTVVRFADNSDQDSFDHDARLEGEWTIQRLTLGGRARYQIGSGASEDIGNRVRLTRTTAALTTLYQYSGKTAFEVNGYFEGYDYEEDTLVDTAQWRGEAWVNHQALPKTNLSLGATVGSIDRSTGPAERFERIQFRVRYEASEKFGFGLVGGPEFRHADDLGDQTDGFVALNLVWRPADGTFLQVEGYRRTQTSGTGENYTTSGLRMLCRQRLIQRLFVDLSGGYQRSEYDEVASRGGSSREDDLLYVRPAVGFALASWLTCEVMGEYRTNDSTIAARSFDAATAAVAFNVLF